MRFVLAMQVILAATLAARPAMGDSIRVCWIVDGGLAPVERPLAAGEDALTFALQSLVAGPTTAEQAAGASSALPAGVKLVDVSVAAGTVTVDLSAEVLTGLDEGRLLAIFDQFRATLGEFPDIAGIRLTCGGQLLADYLDPPPDVEAAGAGGFQPGLRGALSGHSIAIGPSHGRYWNGSVWNWQRSDPCGLGEAVLEDTNSIRLGQFLHQYLTQDGAVVHVPRQLDESDCCHGATGLAWWKMAARYWLEHLGLPSSIWDSSTSDYNDDIRARPLYADYMGSEIYVSCHTNAGGGTGTETYRDTAMEHAAHEANSLALATAVNANIVDAIRNMYDATWTNRGVKDSAGAFGEIRIPDRPACLIELGFHDHCTKDAPYLTDNFFRSAAEWGLYKGVCQYFGATPTWDKYSCELISDTIPATLAAGEVRDVSITFVNRGVLWTTARSFRLGAVGDSDPFTGLTRVDIAGEVRPGQQYTFTITLTAPATPGTYTTDWRMVRDGVAWFGPTLTRQIEVGGSAPQPTMLLAEDFEAYADQAAFESVWTDTADSAYLLDTAFGNPGQSLRMPSPVSNSLGRYYANLAGTYVGTDLEPLYFQYDLYLEAGGAPNWTSARHYCELRGYSGGSYGSGTLANLLAIGLYNASGDTFSTTRYQGRVFNSGASATQWYSLDAEPTAPSRSTGWHQVRIEVRTSQVKFYIDGQLAETVARFYPDGFNAVLLGSDLTAGGNQVYVDDLQIWAYLRAPGDFDNDGAVDLADFAQFAECLTGPCLAPPCDPALYGSDPDCPVGDFDADGDVDLIDCAELLAIFE